MSQGADDDQGLELDQTTLDLLRRAGIERQELGERLARHEFQTLRRELTSDVPFALAVELPGPPHWPHKAQPAETLPEFHADVSTFSVLPKLPVPLGRIAWVGQPEDLPVTGILIPELDETLLAVLLLALLTEHHRQPFARLLFLCRDLTPVHFLGRYGFISHDIGCAEVSDIGDLFERRYGLQQIRSIESGAKIWQSDKWNRENEFF